MLHSGLHESILTASEVKKDIHPPYYPEATVRCACGQTWKTGSTKPEFEVEICSHCHPFYTGKEKMIDTAGRVDRYRRMVEKAKTLKTAKRTKTAADNG